MSSIATWCRRAAVGSLVLESRARIAHGERASSVLAWVHSTDADLYERVTVTHVGKRWVVTFHYSDTFRYEDPASFATVEDAARYLASWGIGALQAQEESR